jgi:hypothetical protein
MAVTSWNLYTNSYSLFLYHSGSSNPTSGEFKLNVNSDVEVSVYNQLGQVIIPAREYAPNKTLSVKEKGIYFVRIKDSKGFKTQKLVVK